MSVRERLKKQPLAGFAVVACLLGGTAYMLFSQSRPPEVEQRPQMFYSADDGKTFFPAELGKPVPFEHDGREAVRAYVFSSDGGKTRVVGFLEKYSPELRQKLIEAKGDRLKEGSAMALIGPAGILVKRPGESAWVDGDDPRSSEIRTVRSPNGQPLQAVIAETR